MDINQIVQFVTVIVILIVVAEWIVRRLRRRQRGGCHTCDGCPLSPTCRPKPK